MIITTEIDRLTAVPAAQWDFLASGAHLYQSYAWLRWAQEYHRLPVRYVLAKNADGTLLGAVVTYLMRDVPDNLTKWYDPVRMFLTPYCEPGEAERRWFPVLLVGGCSGGHSEILYAPGLDKGDRAAVTRALLDRCRAIAEEHNCGSLAFMYAPEEACDEVTDALSVPARKILTSAKAVLTLDPGGDFDSYLHGFAYERRRKLAREVRDFAAAGGTVATYQLGEVLSRIAPLLGAHQRKYGDPVTDAETLRYLQQQEAYLGTGSTVFVDERDSDLGGVALSYTHEDTLYGRACGFDPQRAAPFAYFNLTLYAAVGWAAEHRLTRIDLGSSSLPGKRRRGADVLALWSVVVPPENLEPDWTWALRRPTPQAHFAGVT